MHFPEGTSPAVMRRALGEFLASHQSSYYGNSPDAMHNLRTMAPEYNDMPDSTLAEKIIEKYPAYKGAFARLLTG
jgi:hypothetical protein